MLAGCASTAGRMQALIDEGEYEEAIDEGEAWLGDHSREGNREAFDEGNREAFDEVRRLVIEAEFWTALNQDTTADYQAFRNRRFGEPLAEPFLVRSFELEATASLRDDVRPGATVEGYQGFRERYEGTSAANTAFSEEAALALGQLRAESTVEELREYQSYYATAPDVAHLMSSARSLEAQQALADVMDLNDPEALRQYQITYATYREATDPLTEAYEREAELELGIARNNGLHSLLEFPTRYTEDHWQVRAEEELVDFLLEPVRNASSAALPSHEEIDVIADFVGEIPSLHLTADSWQTDVWRLASRQVHAPLLRAYYYLYPGGEHRTEAEDILRDVLWEEAHTLDTQMAWWRFLALFPQGDAGLEAEQRWLWQRVLARRGDNGLFAEVTSQRRLDDDTLEITVWVTDCLGRTVVGLAEESFRIFEGSTERSITRFFNIDGNRPLDLVFALDLSGSMQVERVAVEQTLAQVSDIFLFRSRPVEFGLVGFSDEIEFDERPTTNLEEFFEWLSELPANLGGGLGEDGVNALIESSRLMRDRQRERVILMITDEGLQAGLRGRERLEVEASECGRFTDLNQCLTSCRSYETECRGECYYGFLTHTEISLLQGCKHNETCFQTRLGELNACSETLGADSELLANLVPELTGRSARTFFIIPPMSELVGWTSTFDTTGFAELAWQLGGRVYSVPNEINVPEPFEERMLEMTRQLSSEYTLRVESSFTETGTIRVALQPGYRWLYGASVPEHVVGVVTSATTDDCPQLLLVTHSGTWHQSSDCGESWPWDGDLGTGPVLAAETNGNHIAVHTADNSVWYGSLEADGSLVPLLVHSNLDGFVVDDILLTEETLWVLTGHPDRLLISIGPEVDQSWAVPEELSDHLILTPNANDSSTVPCLADIDGGWWCFDQADGFFEMSVSHDLPTVAFDDESTPFFLHQTEMRDLVLLWVGPGRTFRSIDGGQQWHEVLVESEVEYAPVEWRTRDEWQFCAPSTNQVYCSQDDGRSWQTVGLPFQSRDVVHLVSLGGNFARIHDAEMLFERRVINRETADSMVFFDTDSALPRDNIAPFLNEIAEWMHSESSLILQIEGHADERGNEQYNYELGLERAQTVSDMLTEQGVETRRLEAVSYGETRPRNSGQGSDAWASNRRVEFILLESEQTSTETFTCPDEVFAHRYNDTLCERLLNHWLSCPGENCSNNGCDQFDLFQDQLVEWCENVGSEYAGPLSVISCDDIRSFFSGELPPEVFGSVGLPHDFFGPGVDTSNTNK